MRFLFWILLLGNVILFAVIQRGGLGWGEQRVQAQPDLHGEMIRLMPAPQSEPAKAIPVLAPTPVVAPPAPVPASSPSPTNLQPSSNMAAPEAAKPGKLTCLEWGDFSGPDLSRARAALSDLQLADKLSQRQVEREIGYWVYIPPLRNRAAVNRKIAELKALGIREYFVVQTPGSLLNAISLGIFKTRDAAQHFLQALNTRGVRTARVGERLSKVKAIIFVLNNPDAATEARLTAMQKEFPGSELNHVPCGLTR